MPPPRAPRRPHRHEKHGDVRVDDYYWLRERDNPEVREPIWRPRTPTSGR